ncbi:hypothetical protein BCR33DRAFT_782784 [Rhizoclosmatium globosum]|uniref:Uncharacterized protein n=1 Tax=Rhizoclosmatium globosum TaxID=329046 RepID=A0A1Y2CKZ0_9FUNG|nr:hypothetical protein BCR33DRAFT_782784 [Rhizoclosmatium globosum]|eukprot:ORY47688.1 hypothetical protein BCR33DRAFT_782784 [Rhizoclosmatium globosum]
MLAASQIVDDSKWPFIACMEDGTQVSEETECQVSGVIPNWLEGQLYRTGPGIYEVNSDGRTITLDHWFDGAGITHLFKLNPMEAALRIVTVSLPNTSDPCQTLFQKVFSFFKSRERSVNVNVTVTPRLNVPGQAEPITVLKTDSNVLQILDSKTLEPVDQTNYRILNGEFAKGHFRRHEEYDPVTIPLSTL